MSKKHHSPKARPAKPYRARPVHANAVLMAINGARRLSEADVHSLITGHRQMLREYTAGQHCAQHWRSLADIGNLAETFVRMGLASGQQAEELVHTAQVALASAAQRQSVRGTWTLYPQEIDALHWLLQLHALQLQACSYSEFCAAMDSTQRRISQARQGNAPAGALVVQGDFGASTASPVPPTAPPQHHHHLIA
jgi:hypothetical protein